MEIKELLNITLQNLEKNGAENIISIDLNGKTNIADYIIVASGTSNRNVITLAEKLIFDLKQQGLKNIVSEGLTFGDWVAIDLGSIIVHIFKPEVREYYNIENNW